MSAARADGGRRQAMLRRLRDVLCAAGMMAMLAGSTALAENLDAGKSPARLFADSCASCHRTPRGLAKGRFRLTLYLFLQKHYSSGSDSASALTSYLLSLDGPAPGPARGARPAHPRFRPERPPRPPMPVRGR